MTLSVALQMDPLDGIDLDGDSSFALGLEAQRRGHKLWHYLVTAMSYQDGALTARGHDLALRREVGNHFTHGAEEVRALDGFDVILMRQDPPFDMQYIWATHHLEAIHPKTLVVNNPREVRNAPEKLFVTEFRDFMPPTLISRDPKTITAFRDEHKDIVVKPLFGNGGAGIFHLKPDDENLSALLEGHLEQSREPLMVQRYLPAIKEGDKRIILVDGKPIGGINRIPAKGEARANLHVGGRAAPVELTKREHEMCEALGPELKKRGLIFVGIDSIGDMLTEINVTSPTGLQELGRFNGTVGTDKAPEALIWDAIEAHLS